MKPINAAKHIAFLIWTLHMATGSDVVLGILGMPAFIECQLAVSETLVWQIQFGPIIAMNGKVLIENTTKYVVQKQTGFREILVIHDVSLDDDRIYQCHEITNRSAIDATKLNVLVKPAAMRLVKPDQPLLEGQKAVFSCEADRAKPLPDVRWFIKDVHGNITEIAGHVTDTMYINSTGTRTNTWRVNVTRDMFLTSLECNVSVSVLYQEAMVVDLDISLIPGKPMFIDFDGSFDAGSPKTFVCVSNGSRPTATISWSLDGQPMGEFDFVVIPQLNGTSNVRSTVRRTLSRDFDGSTLTCAVTNKVLEARGLPPLMSHITLRASYSPKVEVVTSNVFVREHDNVTLNCTVDALPQLISAVWIFNGAVVDKRLYGMTNNATSFLMTLVNVKRSDAGNYSCHVSNRLGSTTSQPIILTVQYAPACVSDAMLAANIGQGLSISCQMLGSPSAMTLTWRVQGHNTTFFKQNATVTSADHAFGTYEYIPRSPRDYTTLECFGTNVVGTSDDPCIFHILPRSPPLAPDSCNSTSYGKDITIHCNAGFDGGFTQHFTLKKMATAAYETFMKNDIPFFRFETFENITARVCAENDGFPGKEVCSASLSIIYLEHDTPGNAQKEANNSTRLAYIVAGGVIAAIGVITIAILVVLMLRRYRKTNISKIIAKSDVSQDKSTYEKRGLTSWFSKYISRKSMERATPKQPHSTATTVVQRNQIITQTKPFSSVSSVLLTSTPYQSTPNRNGRNTNYDINNITIAEANTDMDIGRNCCAPDILCDSTGFAMSPISHNQISNDLDGYDDQTPRLNLNVSELTTHGQEQFSRSANTISIFSENETTDNGISNCYYTEDIMEVLSEHGSASFPAYEASPNSSLKSEASFTTLGRIFLDNDEPKDIGDIVIHQRYADDTDITENNRKTLSSNSYISTRSAYRQSFGNVSLDVARKDYWDNTTTHFKKSFTLPSKIKMNHKSQNVKACLQNDDDIKISDTFIVNDYSQMQTPIVLRKEAPVNNGDSKDSIDEFTTWSNSYELRTTRQDIACDDAFLPHSDDDSNSVCDIDEYTLTVTSETTTEAKDDLGENTSISSNFENELESDSAEVESTNKQLTHTMRNRSDSFMVAVSGSIFEDDVKEQTDNITAMAFYLDAERVYCNYGFREDESSMATRSRDSSHVQPHSTNIAQNECSAIDVMAFF